MKVGGFDANFNQIGGEVFGHALGESGYQYPLFLFDALLYFVNDVVGLVFDRADVDSRIK